MLTCFLHNPPVLLDLCSAAAIQALQHFNLHSVNRKAFAPTSPKKGAEAALLAAGWLSCAAALCRSAVWPLIPVTFSTIKANILSLFVFVDPPPPRKSWSHIIRDNWDGRSQKCGMNCAHMGRHGSVFFFSLFHVFRMSS